MEDIIEKIKEYKLTKMVRPQLKIFYRLSKVLIFQPEQ